MTRENEAVFALLLIFAGAVIIITNHFRLNFDPIVFLLLGSAAAVGGGLWLYRLATGGR